MVEETTFLPCFPPCEISPLTITTFIKSHQLSCLLTKVFTGTSKDVVLFTPQSLNANVSEKIRESFTSG